MPLRRRPPEPSPRLRALLASTASPGRTDPRSAAVPGHTGVPSVPVGAGAAAASQQGAPLVVERSAAVIPWQPERTWIEQVPSPGTGARAAGGVRVREVTDRPARGGGGRHRRPAPPRARFLTLPEALVGARLSGPRAAVAGLLVVAVVAATGFGVRVAWARAASTPTVVAPAQPGSAVVGRAAGATGFASSSTASGGGGPPTTSTATLLTVHVVGQVRRPGVIRLAAGSRVADAVAEAGGALEGADLAAVNLARPLADGEQVRIPKPGESTVPVDGVAGGAGSAGPGGTSSGSSGGVPAGSGSAGGGTLPGGKLDLNRATASELDQLPGVGPVLAQRILDWRTEHGRFASVDELGEVSGIGEKIFAQLQPKVTV